MFVGNALRDILVLTDIQIRHAFYPITDLLTEILVWEIQIVTPTFVSIKYVKRLKNLVPIIATSRGCVSFKMNQGKLWKIVIMTTRFVKQSAIAIVHL